jgi:SNF2 family DNA or RNA helicase
MSLLKSLWSGFQYQDHQVTGVRWMIEREALTPSGGILCDEMGLGKTIQLLGLMKETSSTTSLLLAPLCTLDQWQETAERCGFCVWRCHSSKSTWELPANFRPGAKHLYILNYERAISRPVLVNQRVWGRAVFDEAHRLSDPKSASYLFVQKEISANARWFLTATPIVNTLRDVISLFQLLGYKNLSATAVESLTKVIHDHVLCRRMEDLRDVMPGIPSAAKDHKHLLDFETDDEAEFYRGIQGIIQSRFRMLQHEEGGQAEMFRLIMRLRQISIHPQVYIGARKREWGTYGRDNWDEPSTKFVMLKNLIEAQCSEPHRWLVFCHFYDEMKLLQEYLVSECPVVRECSMYSGSLSAKEKAAAIKTSKEPLVGSQQEVLLVQLKCGGVGLNLQHCDRIIFMGPWWTAALMDQAVGRAVRIGQEKQVEVHRLILKEEDSMNIDTKMLEAAERKRDLGNRFLSIARGPDAGGDPVEEATVANLIGAGAGGGAGLIGAGAGPVVATTSVDEDGFEQLPSIADNENPC